MRFFQIVKILVLTVASITLVVILNDDRKVTRIALYSTRTYSFVKSQIINIASGQEQGVQDFCSYKTNVKTGVKVLAYTLYGRWAKNRLWVEHMKLIADEVKKSTFYKDWQIRLYHDSVLPLDFRKLLTESNIECCNVTQLPVIGNFDLVSGREWRFLPIGDKTVDVLCSRDLDTPILQREADAVNEWLKSGKLFHSMRDHPQHGEWRVLAGLFCIRTEKNRTLSDMVFSSILKHKHNRTRSREPHKISDQELLRDHVLPFVKHDIMEHDAYNCQLFRGTVPFPSQRFTNSSGFMGCKRPCSRIVPPCPKECRPREHKDWEYC